VVRLVQRRVPYGRARTFVEPSALAFKHFVEVWRRDVVEDGVQVGWVVYLVDEQGLQVGTCQQKDNVIYHQIILQSGNCVYNSPTAVL